MKEDFREVEKQALEIHLMRPDSRSHELTAVINEQVRLRTNYLISLRTQVVALQKIYCERQIAAAKVLTYWLKQQGCKLYKPTITSQSRLVDNLVHERELRTEIDEAITLLRLEGQVKSIIDINNQIDAKFMQRNNEMAARTEKSKTIRKAAYYQLKTFLNSMDNELRRAKNRNKETIYHQYSREINELLTKYRTPLKIRSTKRKNKKEVATAIKELLHNSQLEPQKMLPVGIYEEIKEGPSTGSGRSKLKTNESVMHPTNRMSAAGATPAPETGLKNQMNIERKPNSEELPITKKDGDEKFPPININ